jgi:L-ascorbate metabolism protein UlaG (beta-lactamase superfamily)
MEIQRTANAGALLRLDGVTILLDGLCDGIDVYLPTPPAIADSLQVNLPDVLAFTHNHPDHYSEALLLPYRKQNLRPIFGPEYLPMQTMRVGEISITAVPSRHIGKTEPGLSHHSLIIKGSKCVWFMGDAAPLQWKDRTDLPKADVLIAPFAYANTRSAWELACRLADKVVLLHLPERTNDPYGLWQAVESTTSGASNLYIPKVGETIII